MKKKRPLPIFYSQLPGAFPVVLTPKHTIYALLRNCRLFSLKHMTRNKHTHMADQHLHAEYANTTTTKPNQPRTVADTQEWDLPEKIEFLLQVLCTPNFLALPTKVSLGMTLSSYYGYKYLYCILQDSH